MPYPTRPPPRASENHNHSQSIPQMAHGILPAAKHHKSSAGGEQPHQEPQSLLPGLPDHLAHLCLSLVPPTLLFTVCRSWRRLLYSPSFPPFLALYALLSSNPEDPIGFYSFDPIASTWSPLPPPPPDPPLRHLLLYHPSFIARNLPVQSVAASEHLVLLAATTHRLRPALPRPLVFHPASRRWRLGPEIPTPRRWCAAGASDGSIYIASGVGSDYSAEVARSVERWDPRRRGVGWERVAPLRDGRFSRDAVEAVSSGRKLCMVNVKGRAAKEGAVYDVKLDRWEEMPAGLISGYTGPAAAAEGGLIYVVDEDRGMLREYHWESDSWRVVVESERLKGATAIAAGGGRVCVSCSSGATVVVVDVGARPGRMWVVYPPPGKRVISLHVLPRMSLDDF